MTTLEQLLRETFADLAQDAPAPTGGRADTALAGLRRRRVGLAVAAAAVVLAGAVLVPFLLRDAPPEPARPPATSLRLTDVARTGEFQVTSYSAGGASYVRRPGDAAFREVPYPVAVVSSRGQAAVMARSPDSRVGLLDVGTGDVRWVDLPGPSVGPAWSPDGRTLLVTGLGNGPVTGALRRAGPLFVDPATGAVNGYGVEQDEEPPRPLPPERQALGWDSSGRYVVGTWRRTGPKDGYTARWWDLTGQFTQQLPGGGAVAAPGAPVSPRGTWVALGTASGIAFQDPWGDGPYVPYELPTTTAVGWRDDTGLVVEVPGGFDLLSVTGERVPYARWSGPGPYGTAGLTRW